MSVQMKETSNHLKAKAKTDFGHGRESQDQATKSEDIRRAHRARLLRTQHETMQRMA